MYLADYHCHTECSHDSTASLPVMAQAALAAGLSELCITDHCDLIGGYGEPLTGYDWTPALLQMEKGRRLFDGRLTLRLGIELGMGHVNAELTRKILDCPALDFVIGSIHNLSPARGGTDFFFVQYPDEASCHAALEDYFTSMLALCESDAYDVLGHIPYPLRYMPFPITLERYEPVLRAILTRVAARGKGIEMNTNRGRDLEEWRSILTLFFDCGGRYVTVGADAHTPVMVGRGIPQAYRLMRETGFPQVTLYEKRIPHLRDIMEET